MFTRFRGTGRRNAPGGEVPRRVVGTSGHGLIEYVILAVLLAVAVGLAMMSLRGTVTKNFEATTSDLTTPVGS